MTPQLPVLAIVVPCHNEEEVIQETARQLLNVLSGLVVEDKIHHDSFVYFVDDGSHDNTWHLVTEMHELNPSIKGLKLSRNVGHQSALLAGLLTVKIHADCVISIDADLQDDVTVIPQFIENFLNGAEIVYGVRNRRKADTFFKRNTALFFYALMRAMRVEIVYNHADYRLCSRRVLDALEGFQERNLFLRGIFPLIGYKSEVVYYNRHERFAGESKYPLLKMLAFAIDGITSFSVIPLRLVTLMGFAISAMSLLIVAFLLTQTLMIGGTVPGWASTVLPIYFIGGVQLLGLGVVGEYVGKIYKEAKARPRFFCDYELF